MPKVCVINAIIDMDVANLQPNVNTLKDFRTPRINACPVIKETGICTKNKNSQNNMNNMNKCSQNVMNRFKAERNYYNNNK